jgi:hypothetical protein
MGRKRLMQIITETQAGAVMNQINEVVAGNHKSGFELEE